MRTCLHQDQRHLRGCGTPAETPVENTKERQVRRSQGECLRQEQIKRHSGWAQCTGLGNDLTSIKVLVSTVQTHVLHIHLD